MNPLHPSYMSAPERLTEVAEILAAGFMRYGPVDPELWRRAADYVSRILRGAGTAASNRRTNKF